MARRPRDVRHRPLTKVETGVLLREARAAYAFSRHPQRGGWRGEDAKVMKAYYKGIGDTLSAVAKMYGYARRRRYSRIIPSGLY